MSTIDTIINADPSSIVVTRYTKVPNAGGFSWTPSVKAAQTVRCYQFTTRNQREFQMPEGEIKQIVLGVLAQPGADLQFSHDARDEFVYKNRTYRIVGERDYDDANIMDGFCTQCDCVAV